MLEKINVGDIMYSSWGYEQTNIDWYKVVKITVAKSGANTIHLQKMSSEVVYNSISMTGTSLPGEVIETSNVFRRKALTGGSSAAVKLNSYSYAWKWDSRPKNYSCYN